MCVIRLVPRFGRAKMTWGQILGKSPTSCAFRLRVRGNAGGGFAGEVARGTHCHPQPNLLNFSCEGKVGLVVEGRQAGGVGWRPAYLVERHEVFGYGREG